MIWDVIDKGATYRIEGDIADVTPEKIEEFIDQHMAKALKQYVAPETPPPQPKSEPIPSV